MDKHFSDISVFCVNFTILSQRMCYNEKKPTKGGCYYEDKHNRQKLSSE